MRALTAPILAVALVLALAAPITLASTLTASQSITPSRAGVRALTGPVVVTINGAGATPQALTVDTGSVVQWWNRDDIPHTITADDGSFGPLQINDGDRSAAISLPPGMHDYHINSVSSVTGTIVVRDNTQPPASTATVTPNATSSPTPPASATAQGTSSATVVASPSATGTISDTGAPSPTGAASPSATDVGTPPATTVPITIDDNTIDPTVVTVTEGMDVQWTNLGTSSIVVTQFGGFVVGPIAPGTSARRQFDLAGRYPYYVQGTSLSGLVIVQPAGLIPTSTATTLPISPTGTPIPPTGTPISPTDTSVPPSSTPTASPAAATATPTSSATTMSSPTTTATLTSSATATDAAEPTAGASQPSATASLTATQLPPPQPPLQHH